MTLIDEHTRECLALRVARRINSFGVIETLADAMLHRGISEHVRYDNGTEVIAKALQRQLVGLGTKSLYIKPGSLWKNVYCESFDGKQQDECLKPELFYSLREAQALNGAWMDHHHRARPRSSFAYRPPAPAPALATQLPTSGRVVVSAPYPKCHSGHHRGRVPPSRLPKALLIEQAG